KLFGNSLKGNLLTFNDTEEKVYAEGKIDMGVELGKKIRIEAAGSVTDEMGKDEITIDLVTLMYFEFLPEATELMLKAFEINGFGADPTRDDREIFAKAISELLPEKEATKL